PPPCRHATTHARWPPPSPFLTSPRTRKIRIPPHPAAGFRHPSVVCSRLPPPSVVLELCSSGSTYVLLAHLGRRVRPCASYKNRQAKGSWLVA
uniref:Uncharacterized protein n=1 Tax=Oryza brachyantha TaxID=4533 RepID=J3LJZ5_ORYBR